MTEEERQTGHDNFNEKSAAQLARELLRLLLLLLWKVFLWCIRRILKGVLLCIEAIEDGTERLNDWWHDNNTQEKVAKTKAWLKMALRTLGRWCIRALRALARWSLIAMAATLKGSIIALKATWRGIVKGTKYTIQAIIHLGPTLKKAGRLILRGMHAFWQMVKRSRRAMKLHKIKQQRSWQQFRRNGGVKGIIISGSRTISSAIQMFMEEDQDEPAEDAITEDDLMEEALEAGANEGKRSQKIGKTILTHAKSFMDGE